VLGEIAAGNKVVPFVPRGKKTITVPVEATYSNYQLNSLEIRGDSMKGERILGGDYVTFRPCAIWEVYPEKIYVVYIHNTSELIVRKVKYNMDDTVTLRAANPDYPDRTFDAADIEIRGLILKITFDAP
jgi:SOS-response transcriptional repressor LexA